MGDWIGLAFILLLVAGALFGLNRLGRQRVSTEEEFEKRAAESASFLTSGVEAVNGLLNPSAAKAKETIAEVKQGTFSKKKREGKGQGRENKGDQ